MLQDHIDSPRALEDLDRPAVVTIRDPYMSFLTWWKMSSDVIEENIAARTFFRQWELLDEWLAKRNIPPIIFYVDRQPIEQLARWLKVAYVPADEIRGQSAHYISDKYIQPRYENFPPALHDLAEKWGYAYS